MLIVMFCVSNNFYYFILLCRYMIVIKRKWVILKRYLNYINEIRKYDGHWQKKKNTWEALKEELNLEEEELNYRTRQKKQVKYRNAWLNGKEWIILSMRLIQEEWENFQNRERQMAQQKIGTSNKYSDYNITIENYQLNFVQSR